MGDGQDVVAGLAGILIYPHYDIIDEYLDLFHIFWIDPFRAHLLYQRVQSATISVPRLCATRRGRGTVVRQAKISVIAQRFHAKIDQAF
jgi:hypothetical protein